MENSNAVMIVIFNVAGEKKSSDLVSSLITIHLSEDEVHLILQVLQYHWFTTYNLPPQIYVLRTQQTFGKQ